MDFTIVSYAVCVYVKMGKYTRENNRKKKR